MHSRSGPHREHSETTLQADKPLDGFSSAQTQRGRWRKDLVHKVLLKADLGQANEWIHDVEVDAARCKLGYGHCDCPCT